MVFFFFFIARVLIVDPEGESGGTPYRFPVSIVAEDLDVEELLEHVDGTIASMPKPSLDGPSYSYSPDAPVLSCFQKVVYLLSFSNTSNSLWYLFMSFKLVLCLFYSAWKVYENIWTHASLHFHQTCRGV